MQTQPPARVMRLAQLVERPGVHRVLRRHEVEQQDADAVDVGVDRGLPAGEELRREVQRRARQASCRGGARALLHLSGAEVHQDETAALLAHDVLRLDVAVDETGLVDGREGAAQLLADERRLARAERALGPQELLQRAAADVLHPEPDAPVALLGAEHRHHVAMADARQDPPLVQDLAGQLRGGTSRPQQLERHVAVEPRVLRAVDEPERALADLLEQRQVAPELRRAAWALRQDALLDGRQVARRRRDAADDLRGPQLAGGAWRGVDRAVDVGDPREDLQVAQELPLLVVVEAGFDGVPVDVGRPVGDRRRQIDESQRPPAHWRSLDALRAKQLDTTMNLCE